MSSEDLLVKKFLLIIAPTIMKYFNTIITEFYLSTFLMLRVFAVQMKIKSFSLFIGKYPKHIGCLQNSIFKAFKSLKIVRFSC